MINIDELQRLALSATPGPWRVMAPRSDGRSAVERPGYDLYGDEVSEFLLIDTNPDDAEFIAAANPQAILDLIERVWQAEARIAEAAKLHRVEVSKNGYSWCAGCSTDEYAEDWPCLTAVALGLNEGEKDER